MPLVMAWELRSHMLGPMEIKEQPTACAYTARKTVEWVLTNKSVKVFVYSYTALHLMPHAI